MSEEPTNEELLDGFAAAYKWSWDTNKPQQLRAAVLARMTVEPPLGWVLVPKEPTEEMKRASRLVMDLPKDIVTSRVTQWGSNAWAAMLAAAPTPPSTQGETAE